MVKISSECYLAFPQYLSDEEWNDCLDFCLVFPEWIEKESYYDGREYFTMDGYKIYMDDVKSLLSNGRRKPKYIFEVVSDKRDFLEKVFKYKIKGVWLKDE